MRRALLLLPLALATCTYDPPPEVALVPAPGGRWVTGDPLELTFSEAIDPATLAVTIWPDEKTVEGELLEGLSPKLDGCRPAASPCGTTTLTVAADGLSAVLRLDPADLGRPDVPYVLEIGPELADLEGNERTIPAYFDFQLALTRKSNDRPVAFESGNYVIVAELTQPLPVVLTLLSDVRVLEDGSLALTGADGDEKEGYPRSTLDPAGLFVDETEEGFALQILGFVTLTDDDERFLDTDPVKVKLKVGPLEFEIRDAVLSGKIVKDETTGLDRLAGTLSFSAAVLNPGTPDEYAYPAGSTSFAGVQAAAAAMPPGTPDVCTAPCGVVVGTCEIPPGFPPARFCEG